MWQEECKGPFIRHISRRHEKYKRGHFQNRCIWDARGIQKGWFLKTNVCRRQVKCKRAVQKKDVFWREGAYKGVSSTRQVHSRCKWQTSKEGRKEPSM
jgi:hypothetical protein